MILSFSRTPVWQFFIPLHWYILYHTNVPLMFIFILCLFIDSVCSTGYGGAGQTRRAPSECSISTRSAMSDQRLDDLGKNSTGLFIGLEVNILKSWQVNIIKSDRILFKTKWNSPLVKFLAISMALQSALIKRDFLPYLFDNLKQHHLLPMGYSHSVTLQYSLFHFIHTSLTRYHFFCYKKW